MKFLFSPAGLILIVLVLAILFWPRRTPDAIKKRVGKPMRAFPDDPVATQPVDTHAQAGTHDAPSDEAS